ncbi:MAG: hypothetical protein AAF892_12815 [Cyanobacteria bacterium P01_D01_bin.71]
MFWVAAAIAQNMTTWANQPGQDFSQDRKHRVLVSASLVYAQGAALQKAPAIAIALKLLNAASKR